MNSLKLHDQDSFLDYRKEQEQLHREKTDSNDPFSSILTIEINTTELCNRSCVFCPRSDPQVYPNRNLHMTQMGAMYIADHLAENQDLKKLVESPVLGRQQQQAAIIAILKKAGADPLTVKFVGTMAENGRLSALPRVIQAFQQEHARRRGQISAEVVSAVALDDSRKAVVEKTVARLAGSDNLSLSMRVDPSLIGGLVVRIGSRMIDTSIKTKLSRLEAAMKGVA